MKKTAAQLVIYFSTKMYTLSNFSTFTVFVEGDTNKAQGPEGCH